MNDDAIARRCDRARTLRKYPVLESGRSCLLMMKPDRHSISRKIKQPQLEPPCKTGARVETMSGCLEERKDKMTLPC